MLSNRKIRRVWFNLYFNAFNQHYTINHDILKQVEGRKRKVNIYMISGVVDKRKPCSWQSNWQEISDAGKPPSRFHPTSDKGKRLILCSYANIPTEWNIQSGWVSFYWRKKALFIQKSSHKRSIQISGKILGKIKSKNDNNKVFPFQT